MRMLPVAGFRLKRDIPRRSGLRDDGLGFQVIGHLAAANSACKAGSARRQTAAVWRSQFWFTFACNNPYHLGALKPSAETAPIYAGLARERIRIGATTLLIRVRPGGEKGGGLARSGIGAEKLALATRGVISSTQDVAPKV